MRWTPAWELVVRQSPASKNVNTKIEEAMALEAVTRRQPVMIQQTERTYTCCIDLQIVWITNFAIVTCTYDL
jgi:hypothetical protein